MRKFEFVAHYWYVTPVGGGIYATSCPIQVRAWRYKTARRKALEIAQKIVRKCEDADHDVAFRLCRV